MEGTLWLRKGTTEGYTWKGWSRCDQAYHTAEKFAALARREPMCSAWQARGHPLE